MRHWSGRRSLLLAVLTVALFVLITPSAGSAHARLERSEPVAGSTRADAPDRVDLWFSEDLDARSSSVTVYDEDQRQVDAGDSALDPSDPRHLSVSLVNLPDGAYTIAWQTASVEDGHQLKGTFSFRVGLSRLPSGAATTTDDRPSLLAVGLRWLTLLGLALTSGWFLLGRLGGESTGRARWPAFAAAAVAFGADLLLPLVQAYWPAAGLERLPLSTVLASMPPSWQARLALELGLLTLIALAGRRASLRPVLAAGLGLSLLAVGSLIFTSHAAARGSDRELAMLIGAVHLLGFALWLGGLGQLALGWVARRPAQQPVLRRFSRLALLLAPLTIASGVVSAGFLLPSLASLWDSDYGRLLLLKTAAVVLVLALAWRNWRLVRRTALQLARFLRSARLEAAIGLLVVLAGALLALSAPPALSRQQPLHLRLDTGAGQYAHLLLTRPNAGTGTAEAWLSGDDNQPIAEVERVTVSFSMLEQTVDLPTRQAERQPDQRWSLDKAALTVRGWWAANVGFSLPGAEPVSARFVFLLPDPTFAPRSWDRPSDPAARALFDRALDQMLSLDSMRAEEVLSDGIGNSVATTYQFVAPDRLSYVTSSGKESIAVGDEQYDRADGGAWSSRERVQPVAFPAIMSTYYSQSSQHTLGRRVVEDDRDYQLVSFYVPSIPGRDQAWYLWWIGVEDRLVHREAMVGTYHYMNNRLAGFNEPVEIAPPATAATE